MRGVLPFWRHHVSVRAWQLGHRYRRFPRRLSRQSPLTWSICKVMGRPSHSPVLPQPSHA
ncbi:hypothetical protein CP972_13855 [Streptomyces prasinus]|uniref:Uncharacterized protein n=1 Tax=Streptomyces prasinus TaxID=67345 RepID=A0ABX6AXU9_9ACTN|nr:hypothetical protein CP972_13855 [Streptomyces prasinus]